MNKPGKSSSGNPFPTALASAASVTASDTAAACKRMDATSQQLPVTRSTVRGETPKRGTPTPK